MRFLRSLSTRVALTAGFLALLGSGALSAILIRALRDQILAEVIHGSESIAEALSLSIHQDMRLNRREGVREIIETVGRHPGIVGVRLLNKDGGVSYSSRPEEVGGVVDKGSEECRTCHGGNRPSSSLAPGERSRIYTAADGRSVLGTIHVIRNEAGCQGGGCHPSPTRQSILGVLDVAMSLEPAQERLADATGKAATISLAAVLLITGALFFVVWHSVRNPVDRMVAATRKVASGDAPLRVPRRAASEFRMLAGAVNGLVEDLNSSRAHLEAWAGSLEEKLEDKAVELRTAQLQVAQAEKLASVGLVAAGIAHELNSPLMAIITYAHLARQAIGEDGQASEDLRTIEREANRCAAIIRQLLDFSRKQATDPETEACSIHAAVDGALDLLKVELQNGHITTRVRIERELPMVEANQVQLMQIFVNLFLNAMHAMADGGRLTVGADVVARDAYADAGLHPHAGNELVRTKVTDTGAGIPSENLARVFDPFFTTKAVGQGSGLGLSVSLGLAQSYGGTIMAESDGATGSTFTVLLPVWVPKEGAR